MPAARHNVGRGHPELNLPIWDQTFPITHWMGSGQTHHLLGPEDFDDEELPSTCSIRVRILARTLSRTDRADSAVMVVDAALNSE
jgi:hypothetical protein